MPVVWCMCVLTGLAHMSSHRCVLCGHSDMTVPQRPVLQLGEVLAGCVCQGFHHPSLQAGSLLMLQSSYSKLCLLIYFHILFHVIWLLNMCVLNICMIMF